MLYLISQVLLLLALASVISGLIGWLLRALQSDRREQSLEKRLHSSQRAVPSMRRALEAAHYEIDRRENDIHRLRRKIAEIDSDPSNFREGDFDNLDGMHPEDHAYNLVRERALSGNSDFRSDDFAEGHPVSEEEQERAVEYLNTRIEDTDGKYREGDFPNGQPVTDAEQHVASGIDAQRTVPETIYRQGDFVDGVPGNDKEQRYADHIVELRNENKVERQAAREYRRVLILELDKAQTSLEVAQQKVVDLQSESGKKDFIHNNKQEGLEQALANAHVVIGQREQEVEDLTVKIQELDNNPENFRIGDLENLTGLTADEKAELLHLARVNSGNSNFRENDFANGQPASNEEQQRAAEYLKTRIEDTDGKYREGDFTHGTPRTQEEQVRSDVINNMRSEPESIYRQGDFAKGVPTTETEQRYADHIDQLRDKNKADRTAAREHRRILVIELEKAKARLEEAQQEVVDLQLQSGKKDNKVEKLEQALANAHDVIEQREREIKDLTAEIKAIDHAPANFRAGDLKNLDGASADQVAEQLHLARANSGNSSYRQSDFADGTPQSQAESLQASEFLKARDEDTDGKYREGDFIHGTPQTQEEQVRSVVINNMRSEPEKHYRDSDFAGGQPNNEDEIKLAAQIDVMRAKNKATRKVAKQRRRVLVKRLRESRDELVKAKADIEDLQQKLSLAPSAGEIASLEKALANANNVIDRREKHIEKLDQKILDIDTNPKNFRDGDLQFLNGMTAVERAMEIAIARATSGNSQFRGHDFQGRVPLTEDEKTRAIEYLASRDEDTDGKYRDADFGGKAPQTAAQQAQAASIDGMRTEPEKHYRDGDFEGEKPVNEAEIKLAARIDVMRAKNKAYRSAAKKQRKVLKQDLESAREAQKDARAVVAELESRISTYKDKLHDDLPRLKSELALANAQLAERNHELVKTTAAKDRVVQDLQNSLNNEKLNNTRLEQEIERLRKELRDAGNGNEQALQDLMEKQRLATEQRVKELEAALNDHTSEKSQTWDELKKELQSANNQLADYQLNDSELRNRIEVLESMLQEQRRLAGQSMSNRIREIEAMLSAERRKVESLTIQSSISEVSTTSVATPKIVSVAKRRSSKKS